MATPKQPAKSSFETALHTYFNDIGNATQELKEAKLSFIKIEEYLDNNLLVSKKKKKAIPYSAVERTDALDDGLRVEDTEFSLLVVIEEEGPINIPLKQGALGQASGLTNNMLFYTQNWTHMMNSFKSNVQTCLGKFCKENTEYNGRLALRCIDTAFQLEVHRHPNTLERAGVSIMSKKKTIVPWFTIHVSLILEDCATQKQYCAKKVSQSIPLQGSIWRPMVEDVMAKNFNTCQKACLRILQALAHPVPFCHGLNSEVFKALILKNSPMDWSQDQLAERVLCLIDDLEKLLRRCDFPHPMVEGINLFEGLRTKSNKRKASNKTATHLTDLMVMHCGLAAIILQGVVQRDHMQPQQQPQQQQQQHQQQQHQQKQRED